MDISEPKESSGLVVGIGSALVDILAHEDDQFLEAISDIKGGMTYVDITFIKDLLSKMYKSPKIVPGGAACNTIVGIGKLGGDARFVGKLGIDEFGDLFESGLKQSGVKPLLLKSDTPTGRVLSIITPDAQRSMFTFLGASALMLPEEITSEKFENAKIVLVEGYLLFNQELIMSALEHAKKSTASIAMDLSSFTVVEQFKTEFESIVADYVDILIANEDEATAFTGYTDEQKAIEKLSQNVDIAVLKLGKRGSLISYDNNIIQIDPMGDGYAVDTTGAGDLWASGFLYGLVNGYPMEKCGTIGSACGYEVCQVEGADVSDQGWQRIRKFL